MEGNIGWMVKEVHLTYKSGANHGDELEIFLFISNKTRTSFTLDHGVENNTTGKTLCSSTITLVCFDFKKNKPSKIPDILLHAMSRVKNPYSNVARVQRSGIRATS